MCISMLFIDCCSFFVINHVTIAYFWSLPYHLRACPSQSQALETCTLRFTRSALARHQLLKRPPGTALGHSTVHFRPENCYTALSQAHRRQIENSREISGAGLFTGLKESTLLFYLCNVGLISNVC